MEKRSWHSLWRFHIMMMWRWWRCCEGFGSCYVRKTFVNVSFTFLNFIFWWFAFKNVHLSYFFCMIKKDRWKLLWTILCFGHGPWYCSPPIMKETSLVPISIQTTFTPKMSLHLQHCHHPLPNFAIQTKKLKIKCIQLHASIKSAI